MAIIKNSPLGFSDENECDCRSNNYCQVVAKEDNTVWQIGASCDNDVIVGSAKLPCEDNIITDYTTQFANKSSSWVNNINSEVSFFADYIRLTNAADTNNYIGTPNGTLQSDRYYVLRYTISGYTEGVINTVSEDSLGATIVGPSRIANGTYEEVITAGTNGRFAFRYGNGTASPESSLIISNIFVACIRISQQWDIPTILASELTFGSQTGFCTSGATGFTMPLRDAFKNNLVIGQQYKICFTLTQDSALIGALVLHFGTSTTNINAAGSYCYNLVYDSALVDFRLNAGFVGCLKDIQITLQPIINAGLFDENGNEVVDGLNIDTVEDTLRVSLNDEIAEGCYTIGVADSCSNFKNQFYGSIINKPIDQVYAPNNWINRETGAGILTYDGSEGYLNTVLFKDVLCCGKSYEGKITLQLAVAGEGSFFINSVTVNFFQGQSTLLGTITQSSPGASTVFEFNLTASDACESTDLYMEIEFGYAATPDANQMIFNFNFDNLANTIISMESGQLCPEMYSTCLSVVNTAPCESILIKYRNDSDALGFDYSSPEYTEDAGFYNQLRIIAKVWKQNSSKTLNVLRKSSGYSTKFYSDVRRKMVLNTEPLPASIHDAISLALEHRTLFIGNESFVAEQTEYAPEWNKNSMLAPVEVELYIQEARLLNTLCQ